MNIELLKSFFMWCTIINFGILLLWVVMIRFYTELFYQLQSYWFPMSKEKLIASNYIMYGFFKLAVLVFNFVPYVVLLVLI